MHLTIAFFLLFVHVVLNPFSCVYLVLVSRRSMYNLCMFGMDMIFILQMHLEFMVSVYVSETMDDNCVCFYIGLCVRV